VIPPNANFIDVGVGNHKKGFCMKNFFKARIAPLFGIVAFAAIMVFLFAACQNDPDPGNTPGTNPGGLEFSLNNDTDAYSVTGYTGTSSDVVIPATYNGKPVRSIGDYAFENRTSLTSITLPTSVTGIGVSAFEDCTSLASITIPGVRYITGSAFRNCTSLTGITLPASLIYIAARAFENCTSLTGSISIPVGVTDIGNSAFSGCTNLTSISIPASVTTVGYAFSGWTSSQTIYVPWTSSGYAPDGWYRWKDYSNAQIVYQQ